MFSRGIMIATCDNFGRSVNFCNILISMKPHTRNWATKVKVLIGDASINVI